MFASTTHQAASATVHEPGPVNFEGYCANITLKRGTYK